jgi:hypothetical protein
MCEKRKARERETNVCDERRTRERNVLFKDDVRFSMTRGREYTIPFIALGRPVIKNTKSRQSRMRREITKE